MTYILLHLLLSLLILLEFLIVDDVLLLEHLVLFLHLEVELYRHTWVTSKGCLALTESLIEVVPLQLLVGLLEIVNFLSKPLQFLQEDQLLMQSAVGLLASPGGITVVSVGAIASNGMSQVIRCKLLTLQVYQHDSILLFQLFLTRLVLSLFDLLLEHGL